MLLLMKLFFTSQEETKCIRSIDENKGNSKTVSTLEENQDVLSGMPNQVKRRST